MVKEAWNMQEQSDLVAPILTQQMEEEQAEQK